MSTAQSMACPLCGAARTREYESVSSEAIARAWQRDLQIDVSSALKGTSEVRLMRCADCALAFFVPAELAGDSALYARLQTFPWYYQPQKWEHDVALRELRAGAVGLEIGCGVGSFVERAIARGLRFEGCEQNLDAIEAARARQLPVRQVDLNALARDHASAYDVVCSFQVLEHVSRPDAFLRACCTLVKPGGRLILGVPNARSFLRHQFNVLDMPPHHLTRWTSDVMKRLERWFPVRLHRLAYEPLAIHHVHAYVQAYLGLITHRLRAPLPQRAERLLTGLLHKTRLHRLLRGQTLYASYARL